MSNPTWTRERPIVAGWYWWRVEVSDFNIPNVRYCEKAVSIWDTAVGLFVGGQGYLQDLDDGEWLGPITPDSYQQGWVAGIKAVRRKITDLIDRGFTDCEEDMDDLIDWIDFQLAQQAQEGGVGDGHHSNDDEG